MRSEPITDLDNSFRQLIVYNNLYAIKMMIDHNIIDCDQINTILKANMCVNTSAVADFLIDYGLDTYDIDVLDTFLYLYIMMGWETDRIHLLIDKGASFITCNNKLISQIRTHVPHTKIVKYIIDTKVNSLNQITLDNLLHICLKFKDLFDKIDTLIDYGAQMSNNIGDLIFLPDNLFFKYVSDITYIIDEKLIADCIYAKKFDRAKYFCDQFDFTEQEYCNFIALSYTSGEVQIHDMFIDKVNDKLLIFTLLHALNNSNRFYVCTDYENLGIRDDNSKHIVNDLLLRIDLTDSMLLFLKLSTNRDTLVTQFLKTIYLQFNFDIDYCAYFLKNGHEKIVTDIIISMSAGTACVMEKQLEKCTYLLSQINI